MTWDVEWGGLSYKKWKCTEQDYLRIKVYALLAGDLCIEQLNFEDN